MESSRPNPAGSSSAELEKAMMEDAFQNHPLRAANELRSAPSELQTQDPIFGDSSSLILSANAVREKVDQKLASQDPSRWGTSDPQCIGLGGSNEEDSDSGEEEEEERIYGIFVNDREEDGTPIGLVGSVGLTKTEAQQLAAVVRVQEGADCHAVEIGALCPVLHPTPASSTPGMARQHRIRVVRRHARQLAFHKSRQAVFRAAAAARNAIIQEHDEKRAKEWSLGVPEECWSAVPLHFSHYSEFDADMPKYRPSKPIKVQKIAATKEDLSLARKLTKIPEKALHEGFVIVSPIPDPCAGAKARYLARRAREEALSEIQIDTRDFSQNAAQGVAAVALEKDAWKRVGGRDPEEQLGSIYGDDIPRPLVRIYGGFRHEKNALIAREKIERLFPDVHVQVVPLRQRFVADRSAQSIAIELEEAKKAKRKAKKGSQRKSGEDLPSDLYKNAQAKRQKQIREFGAEDTSEKELKLSPEAKSRLQFMQTQEKKLLRSGKDPWRRPAVSSADEASRLGWGCVVL